MAGSVNKAIIMGNLGADPDLRYTQNGAAVAMLSVATNEHWTDDKGEKKSHTEWHRVVVWNRAAENCAKYLQKGSGVHIIGKLTTRSWEDDKGVKRYTTEIVANEIQFTDKAGSGGDRPPMPEDQPHQTSTSGHQHSQNQQRNSGHQHSQNQQRNSGHQPQHQQGEGSPGLEDIPF